MPSQIFDDGSRLDYDDAYNVVGGVDNSGAALSLPGQNGSAIVQQFVNLLSYGARAAIDTRFPAKPAAAAPAPLAAGGINGLLLLGLGGVLLYALVK
jgi:hypothetical protein